MLTTIFPNARTAVVDATDTIEGITFNNKSSDKSGLARRQYVYESQGASLPLALVSTKGGYSGYNTVWFTMIHADTIDITNSKITTSTVATPIDFWISGTSFRFYKVNEDIRNLTDITGTLSSTKQTIPVIWNYNQRQYTSSFDILVG